LEHERQRSKERYRRRLMRQLGCHMAARLKGGVLGLVRWLLSLVHWLLELLELLELLVVRGLLLLLV